MEINWLAVATAALSSFLLGGVWYVALFAKAHQSAAGLSDAQMKSGNPALIFWLGAAIAVVSLGLALMVPSRPAAGFETIFARGIAPQPAE